MSVVEQKDKFKTNNKRELELKGHEAYLNRKQDLENRIQALPLSHFWSCKVYLIYVSLVSQLNKKKYHHMSNGICPVFI